MLNQKAGKPIRGTPPSVFYRRLLDAKMLSPQDLSSTAVAYHAFSGTIWKVRYEWKGDNSHEGFQKTWIDMMSNEWVNTLNQTHLQRAKM